MKKPWLKDAVIYNILIDRFARGGGEPWLDPDHTKPVFCGGNLQGIIDKLDYLKELGVDCILLTPFHPTAAYHGYHVLDFFGVDPRFGMLETVKDLLAQAHARGIRVIMDFVLNHVSREHPYFLDAVSDPESRYRDWFHFTRWPDAYLSFLNFPDLPKLNLRNPDVMEHVASVAEYWTGLGFDGLRLDHIIGVPHDILHAIRERVKARNPDAVVIGEAVKGRIRMNEIKTLQLRMKHFIYLVGRLGLNTTWLMQRQYPGDLDGVFDFFFRDMVRSFYFNRRWYKPRWLLDLILRARHLLYPKGFALITLLDNPDHDRFSFMLKDDPAMLEEVTRLQFAQPDPAMILYGSEAGLKQTASRKIKVYGDKLHGDLAMRATMPWDRIEPKMKEFYVRLIGDKRPKIG
jgi:cyclomaltodextrinase